MRGYLSFVIYNHFSVDMIRKGVFKCQLNGYFIEHLCLIDCFWPILLAFFLLIEKR